MKKILIVMDSLGAGGAEKSLSTLLNVMPKDKFEIDLLLIRHSGLFFKYIPKSIKLLKNIYPFQFLGISSKNIGFYIKHGPIFLLKKIFYYFIAKYCINKLAVNQTLWKLWKDDIKMLNKNYDVAISYLEGITNYYVIDKVNARRKILWIHNEYEKLNYNRNYDLPYFEKADNVVTISERCKNNLIQNFPSINKEKFKVLENITDSEIVKKMSCENIDNELFNNSSGIKLLSVGRLSEQKGYDIALKAASILKEQGIDFVWFIIGEGVLRENLEMLRNKLNLNNHVFFLGLQSNPYNYMKHADIIVQSSRFEGKSIAIDEAKVLCKPIVTTNYNTVLDLIQNGENGIITEMNPNSLANGIRTLINDEELRKKLSENLNKESYNNISEIDKYISIIDK